MENTPRQTLTANIYKDRITPMEHKVKLYDISAATYDEILKENKYSGPKKCAEIVGRYFSHNREAISILDIGCGTGQTAEEMQKRGFKVIDGLDPSEGMIKEAKEKNIYRNLYCNYFTSKPLDFLKDKYDLITVVGSMIIGLIPYDAVIEMIRLTKPGGIVCIVNRKSSLYDFPEYAFLSLCDNLEKEGKWEKEEMMDFDRFLGEADGVAIVYRVK